MTAAQDLYARGLEGEALYLRREDGTVALLPVDRWLGPLTHADESALGRARAPVLDVGCGPGRHVGALAARGVLALGVDVVPAAVRLARLRGAPAVAGSVFDRVPGSGRWGSALLLDGNIGIGGDAERLLTRTAELLRPGGEAIVEVDPPGGGSAVVGMRLEGAGAVGPWFDWAHVDADAIGAIARGAGLHVAGRVEGAGRWFARLRKVAA